MLDMIEKDDIFIQYVKREIIKMCSGVNSKLKQTVKVLVKLC